MRMRDVPALRMAGTVLGYGPIKRRIHKDDRA